MNQQTLFALFLLLMKFEATQEPFCAKWKRQEHVASTLQIAMNNKSDCMNLTTFSLQTFLNDIVDPVKAMLSYPRCQIKQWLHADDDSAFHKPTSGNSPLLSVEDGVMRCIMFHRKCKVKLLEMLRGQKKSIVHEDVLLMLQVLEKVAAN